ncbi:MAG: hypothetical protein CXZ00_07415 [Acidobacteria bacterium]|nr:MAG: hypothetical protein CXZ00_07415 [Acidobacteriota bacterium]
MKESHAETAIQGQHRKTLLNVLYNEPFRFTLLSHTGFSRGALYEWAGIVMSESNVSISPEVQALAFGRECLEFGSYELDLSVVKDAPMLENEQPTTFGQLYVKLRDAKVEQMPDGFAPWRHEYVTSEGAIVASCERHWRLLQLLRELLKLHSQGIEPQSCTWFYYEKDLSLDGDTVHSFFVVGDERIVNEHSCFGSDEPLVLKLKQESDPIWRSWPYYLEALNKYWYRRFYTETRSGQLMILRNDKPYLHYFERPSSVNIPEQRRTWMLAKVHRVLLIMLMLQVALLFPSLKLPCTILAILFGVDYLRHVWQTGHLERQ